MREVKARSRPALETRVLLTGSIELGTGEQWQEQVASALSGAGDLVIHDPRRDDRDESWQQRADDPRLFEQVSLEPDMLDAADVVVAYLAPDTKSPVETLEDLIAGLRARVRST